MTRTVATLEVSAIAFREVSDKLRGAGYDHLFMADGSIDMYGIGLARCADIAPSDAAQAPSDMRAELVTQINRMRKDENRGDTVFRCGFNGAIESIVKLIEAHAAPVAAQSPVAWEVDPVGGVRCITVSEGVAKRHNGRALVYADAAPAAQATQGWKLMPTDPHPQQLTAICESYWGDGWADEYMREARLVDARAMYGAALAAAPVAPAAAAPSAGRRLGGEISQSVAPPGSTVGAESAAPPDERAAFEAWKDKRLPHYNLRHQFREWLFEAFQAGAARASASQATKGWIDLYESAMKTLSPAFDYIQSHADQFGANAGDCKMAIIAETFPRLAADAAHLGALVAAAQQSLLGQIEEILDGIDELETAPGDRGWWETSTGVEFGERCLTKIRVLFEESNLRNCAISQTRDSALHVGDRAAFEWPAHPRFPSPTIRHANGSGYFTEHQMQGYANAYGELVRASASQVSVVLAAAAPSAKWSKEPPTEQGLYWHWSGDLDAGPIPLSVLWSGTTRKCFISIGQYGITQAIDCDEYGGYWQPAIEPEMDEEIGHHGSDA